MRHYYLRITSLPTDPRGQKCPSHYFKIEKLMSIRMSVVYSTPVFVKQKRLLCGLSAVSSLLGKVVEKAELDKLALQFHIDNCSVGGDPIDSAPDPNGNYTIEILILGLERLGNLEINHAFCIDFDFIDQNHII